ncbi:unnamed protein product [Effrenium voratum]|nr:unnamed protein product [Effrenium voratum]
MGAACCSEAKPGQKEQLASGAAPIDAKAKSAQPGPAPVAAASDGDGYNYKVFPDGSRYEGQWKDGLKHGKGRFIYPDGDVYDGEWSDGKAHGHGTYTSKQSKYVGEWQSDLKHGQAVEEWDDTSKYTGTYSHGQKHGKGRFEWPDGSVYDGEFRNNNVEGEGTFTWKDGRQYKGQWVDNRMHGEGRYEWPDGRAYEGQYINDLKEGEGTFLWADGRKFTGQWKDGKQHGVGVFRTAHGDQRTGEWREGVRVCWVDEAGRQSGDDYERYIRELLTGSRGDQADKRKAQAELLKSKAIENARRNTGQELWKRLYGNNQGNDRQTGCASVDIVMEEDKDLLQCLGAGAEMLFGVATLPAGTVLEVTVHGASFYVRCFQLEKFLTICASQNSMAMPPAAALAVNRKPIECREEWMEAIKQFPKLLALADQGNLRIAYCPHSVHHAEYRQAIAEKVLQKLFPNTAKSSEL